MASSEKRRTTASMAAVVFSALFIFQVLLAAGVPWGRAAFGGSSDILTPGLRIASAISALLFLGAIWAVLASAAVIAVGRGARRLARWAMWGYVALFSLSALLNFASSSPWERFGMAPLALLLVACCLLVTRGPGID